jgi:hypothetical protein
MTDLRIEANSHHDDYSAHSSNLEEKWAAGRVENVTAMAPRVTALERKDHYCTSTVGAARAA